MYPSLYKTKSCLIWTTEWHYCKNSTLKLCVRLYPVVAFYLDTEDHDPVTTSTPFQPCQRGLEKETPKGSLVSRIHTVRDVTWNITETTPTSEIADTPVLLSVWEKWIWGFHGQKKRKNTERNASATLRVITRYAYWGYLVFIFFFRETQGSNLNRHWIRCFQMNIDFQHSNVGRYHSNAYDVDWNLEF